MQRTESCGFCLDLPWNLSRITGFHEGPLLRDADSVLTSEESAVKAASKSTLVLMTASEAAVRRADNRSTPSHLFHFLESGHQTRDLGCKM